MPQSQRAACDQTPGDLVPPRAGFDFDVGGDTILCAARGGLGERRQARTGELRAEPGAGIERGQLVPRVFSSGAMTVGRAFQCVVVQQKELVVSGELGVELDHAVAVAHACVETGQRVLRRQRAAAAMRNQPRIRPVCG